MDDAPDVTAAAIVDFLTTKTSAMEKWLISRTKFTQADRAGYTKRVEEVKKKQVRIIVSKN